jgi:FAD/FMN-containing dehydrogenase
MKRRQFCASAISVVTGAALPWQRIWAANGASSGVPAMSTAGKTMTLSSSDVEALRASVRGQLLVPGQNGYDAARRVWNGAFDRKPAVIVQCAGAADISAAVKFARSHAMLVAVRGGGHSLSGQSVCDGGLMIDLSPMKSVRVDPLAKTARVESGVLLGQFDREAQAFGLATTAGTVSHTGVAGLTLGGGFGRIARKYGLACDNLISAELITADGNFVRTSANENPELLWGLRGGGGNFGVVSSFEYRLHAVSPNMIGGPLVFPFVNGRALLRSFADYVSGVPDEMYADAMLVPTPDGKRALLVDVCHSGTAAAAEKELAQLRKIGQPLQDGVKATTYVKLQSGADANFPHGRGYYIKSGFVRSITPQVIDATVDYLEAAGSMPTGIIGFIHQGGAISRVKPNATAFWNRDAQHSVIIIGFWDEPGGASGSMQWVRAGWKSLDPLTDGFSVNELAHDDPSRRVRSTYGDNYPRLVALKKRYDPGNLFRLNANIRPDA